MRGVFLTRPLWPFETNVATGWKLPTSKPAAAAGTSPHPKLRIDVPNSNRKPGPVLPVGEIGRRLQALVGIEQLKSCRLNFDANEPITASVVFYVNEETVEGILELLEDGSWQPPEVPIDE